VPISGGIRRTIVRLIPPEKALFKKYCAPDSIYKAPNGLIDKKSCKIPGKRPFPGNQAHKGFEKGPFSGHQAHKGFEKVLSQGIRRTKVLKRVLSQGIRRTKVLERGAVSKRFVRLIP
jgi:hypothetical protein